MHHLDRYYPLLYFEETIEDSFELILISPSFSEELKTVHLRTKIQVVECYVL